MYIWQFHRKENVAGTASERRAAGVFQQKGPSEESFQKETSVNSRGRKPQKFRKFLLNAGEIVSGSGRRRVTLV